MSKRKFGLLVGALAFAAALLAAPSGILAQQSATVSGRVTDQGTGQPLQGARLFLEGTNRQATTDDEGRYQFRNVADGRVTVRVIAIGYESLASVFTVASGSGTADFALSAAVISLDNLVVTATGEARKREVVNSIARIDVADAIETGQPASVASLIQGRAAGVQIINSSGAIGTGTKIRIRGSSSISLSNEPLLVVDGIRVSTVNEAGFDAGGQTISRLNDFNPEDIESIEIVKGPSAAALYGTAAANGVIIITTKRGHVGKTVWNAYIEQGISNDVETYPNNYRGIDASGDTCRLAASSAGSCTQTGVEMANPLEGSRNPFRTGRREQFGLNVSGGTENVQYYLSGEWENESGVFAIPRQTRDSITATGLELPKFARNPNNLERGSFRANIKTRLNDNTDLTVSTGFVTADIWLPQNDNNSLGILPSGLLGTSDSTDNGGYGFFLPEEVFFVEGRQAIERYTGSANLAWRPTTWLSTKATAGIDFTQRSDFEFQRAGTGPDSGTRLQGFRTSDKTNIYQYTLDLQANARYKLSDAISSKTAIGLQYFRNDFEQIETTGEILAPGSGSQKTSATQFINEDFIELITLGAFAEQTIGIKDRVFLNAALRGDDNSAFGEFSGTVFYPKFGASVVVRESRGGLLDNLRLRGAWGASGQQPGQNSANKFFLSAAVIDGGEEKSGVSNVTRVGGDNAGAGNVNLKPERSQEIELGFEAGLLGKRVGVEFNFYQRVTTDALIRRELAPSLGETETRFENIGETRNRGFEGVLSAAILQGNTLDWDMKVSGSTNSNVLRELGEGIEPIIFGTQRHDEGFPLGGWWQEPFTFDDANGDGIITPDELTIADTTEFLGHSRPRHEVSFFNSFTISKRVRLSGLFDYRGGHKQQNLTGSFRCRFNICQGLNDPAASLEEQARAQTQRVANRTAAGFIEDAWFIKLRELSLTFFAPESWARALRSDRVNLTITGRNLFTITDYTGLDPEVQGQDDVGGANGGFLGRDFLTQPPVRSFSARLNVTF
ncbi:MAG: SusC/RagA family TonB-linked outer membrane protein [Gemmatimonadetes bacterium]|nr:SusC/RagA family TonB-linked outer membrane protein [Gemmatimonadota bacterium]